MVTVNNFSNYIDHETAYNELKNVLEVKLGRTLKDIELRKIEWLARQEYETVGVIISLFKEI